MSCLLLFSATLVLAVILGNLTCELGQVVIVRDRALKLRSLMHALMTAITELSNLLHMKVSKLLRHLPRIMTDSPNESESQQYKTRRLKSENI
ncbi:MAG: hypothetical protein F6J87_28280 [Spirulina sp. SIO3F2]|nr:hypothetical protein [Spirulina sp. SIO3F2]